MTLYYEAGIPASLIPVQFIGWAPTPAHDITGLYNAVVRLKRTRGAYKAGEILHLPPWAIVVRAGVTHHRIRVRQADLPERTDANTLNARA